MIPAGSRRSPHHPSGSYTLTVADLWWNDVEVVTFDVVQPVTMNVTKLPKDFYPTVRDGYKDATEVRYRLNRNADTAIVIRNSKGALVRRVARRDHGGWVERFSWNGQNRNGKPVPAGRYRMTTAAESRWVVGFEVILGAYSPLSMAAMDPVSAVVVSSAMEPSER